MSPAHELYTKFGVLSLGSTETRPTLFRQAVDDNVVL